MKSVFLKTIWQHAARAIKRFIHFLWPSNSTLENTHQKYLTFGNNPKEKRATGLYRDNSVSAVCLQQENNENHHQGSNDSKVTQRTGNQRRRRHRNRQAGRLYWHESQHLKFTSKLWVTQSYPLLPHPPLQSSQTVRDLTQEPWNHGTSLVLQQVRLHVSTAGGMGLIPDETKKKKSKN